MIDYKNNHVLFYFSIMLNDMIVLIGTLEINCGSNPSPGAYFRVLPIIIII
jgi:hypothetical protein